MLRHPRFAKNTRVWVSTTLILSFGLWSAGCSVSTRIRPAQRSSIEQRLLARSLERAFAQLDTSQFNGKSAALEVYGLTDDRHFAEKFIAARMQERGFKITAAPEQADLRFKFFLTALGIDTGQTLLGIPAFSAPVVDLPVPELALFKSDRHRGHTELRLYAFDEKTQTFIQKTPLIEGRSRYDDYKLLLLINFSFDDLDEETRQANSD